MAEFDNTDTDLPQHDTLDFGELEVVDPTGPPPQPESAYEVLPDGEHEYQGDDAPVQ